MLWWEDKTMWGMIADVARRQPRKKGVAFKGQTLTYEELVANICRVAGNLVRQGVKRGDHVGTCLPIGLEFIYVKYALSAIGALLVPINLSFKEREFQFIFNQADVKYLITIDQYRNNPYLETIDRIRKADPGGFRIQKIFVLGNGDLQQASRFEELMQEISPWEKENLVQSSMKISPREDAYLLFTSGSTAFPKGALRSSYSLLGIAYHLMVRCCKIDSSDRILSYLPFYHVGGCVYMLLGAHIAGAELHLQETFDPPAVLRAIEEQKITFISGFDTHFDRILGEMKKGPCEIKSASKVLLATGPDWYDRIREAGFGSDCLVNHYGFTEGTGVAVPPEETDYQVRKYSNGRPFPGVELRICHPETGVALGAGQPGEICLKGWTLFNGYYKMAEETKKAMDEDGFFHTGDYGWLDEKGNLYFRGRYKMMVKTGGENVSQREVEMVIEEYEGVRNVQVTGVPDQIWGEIVVAVIEMQPGSPRDAQKIIAFCKGRLANFKVPKKIIFVDSQQWPVTMTGKIDKFQLKELAIRNLSEA